MLRDEGAAVRRHVVEDARLVLGVNDRVELAQARAIAQRAICEAHMRAGVTIVDPLDAGSTWTSRSAQDAGIEPGTSCAAKRGRRERGVGPQTNADRLADRRAGAGAGRVAPAGRWWQGASVGPFAYLRPGTVLGEGSKAGTFVEIKNSDDRRGAKVPHLSYIGDADVGEGTTSAPARSRPTTTAAPSTARRSASGSRRGRHHVRGAGDVGDGAYTAAGSVITEDVPPARWRWRARARRMRGVRRQRVTSALHSRRMSSAMDTRPSAATSLPIDYNKRLMLFAGRASPQLAEDIAEKLKSTWAR